MYYPKGLAPIPKRYEFCVVMPFGAELLAVACPPRKEPPLHRLPRNQWAGGKSQWHDEAIEDGAAEVWEVVSRATCIAQGSNSEMADEKRPRVQIVLDDGGNQYSATTVHLPKMGMV
jgi:hypothetical protein